MIDLNNILNVLVLISTPRYTPKKIVLLNKEIEKHIITSK
jgi:hypothetical protein